MKRGGKPPKPRGPVAGNASRSLPPLFVLRQRLDQVIEAQPETPTVVEERNREEKRHYEEYRQHTLIISTGDC